MNRAERRRLREKEKTKTATYNFTKEQLTSMVQAQFGEELKKARQAAADEAVNTAMILLLTLPLEVLMNHYWQKSYKQKLPEFTGYVLEYYEKWQSGELDMEKLKADLWEYGGIRLEEE